MITHYECCLCGGPDDPNEDQLVVIPKAVAHKRCYHQAGSDIWAIADRIPCCQARASVARVGGHLLVPREGIPLNEIWVADPGTKDIRRYRVEPDGSLTQLGAPQAVDRHPPPAQGV